MSSRAVTAILLLCLGSTGIIVANLFMTVMIGEINRKRDEAHQIAYLGFTGPKTLSIFNEYRRVYPRGKVWVYAVTAFGIGMGSLLGVAVCLRIIDLF